MKNKENKTTKVSFSFVNKKEENKSVSFLMDKKLYEDICELSCEEKARWLLFYYEEFNKERYQDKKEYENRENFVDIYMDNNINEEQIVSSYKLLQTANLDVEVNIINRLIVEDMLNLLEETDAYIVRMVVMQENSLTDISKELGISVTAVKKRLDKAIERIKALYKIANIESN